MDQALGGIALAAYLTFVALAFGLRAILQRRRTGSGGFNGVAGRPGSADWFAGALFVVAVLFGLAAPALQLLGVVRPVVDGWLPALAGALLTLGGIAATMWAQGSMGDSWRVGVDPAEKTSLVTGGPFDVVRNPIFSAMTVAAAGLTLLAPNVVAIAGLMILVVAIQLQVRVVEEPYLSRVHGEAYVAYAGRVGRLLPNVGRLRS